MTCQTKPYGVLKTLVRSLIYKQFYLKSQYLIIDIFVVSKVTISN